MKNSKNSIKKRIFLSHMLVINICIILTLIVFIICFRLFIRSQTRRQLISAKKILTQTITENLNRNNTKNIDDNEITKNALKTENALKNVQTYATINYALVDKNENLLSIKPNKNQNNFIENKLLPAINRKKLYRQTSNNTAVFLITIGKNRYEVTISHISLHNGQNTYLIIYSDLSKSRSLTNIVVLMLLLILLISAGFGIIISNNVAARISDPIYKLIKYAKKLGERKYDTAIEEYNSDEIGELAGTMHSMANKLSAYDSTIKTFLQNASHELRTPLMSIQGYAEAIKYGVAKEEGAVDIIIEESKRLSELVEDLLFLSKIDSTQEAFKTENVNIANTIKNSIDKVNGIAVKEGKSIKFSTKSDTDIIISGDSEKLTRAIINILGNCLRYCIKNIDVVLSKAENKVIIEISDDGSGFEEASIEHLFDRFYKGKNGNHGLGLAITKSIIERHNGNIIAKNKEAGGAAFLIYLLCK
ncbi:HAMP domain-containing sensor histidine kinase [Clostridium guangxiense]|uniref:HAMP domain-containing sensor histidine kinase n=1 Tax=Clostridium guangxiense TaxID=1662055 RepID=UPI001E5B7489|nr:HAMP domain-containing sensor histidine kinase [Clostridium guangxiense]MCD2348861.1 HAMP domain-containing histidine kinase [Clostridium guangxiense]